MYKTLVYTLVNGDMQWLTHRKHAYAVFYWCSIETMRLSCTVTKILDPKDKGVTSLTFWGHVTSSVTWPLDLAYVVSYWWSIGTMRLSCIVTKILGPKCIGVTTLTFWGHVTSSVTWAFDSAYVAFIGGPLEPCIYLEPLWRYKASKLHLAHLQGQKLTCLLYTSPSPRD